MTAGIDPIPAPPDVLAAIEESGLHLEDADVQRLGHYLAMLLEANRTTNLTGIREPDAAWRRHIADSLSLVPYILATDATRVADVGSGGGLPGIPLAVVLPDIQFTLIEATGKKARFIETAAAALGLANVTVVAERAETVGHDRAQHREQYDVVLARAVGRMAVLAELIMPLVRVGGHALAVKGERAGEEIEEARAALHLLHTYVINEVRTETGIIVVLEKQRKTPRTYPRRPGEPKRAPLGVSRDAT